MSSKTTMDVETDNSESEVEDKEEQKDATKIADIKTDEENEDKSSKAKKEKKPGVIYLSRIPRKMNVKLIREYFSNFGEVDRIYLEPEEKKRKNQPRSFSEGWVEFKRKKIAKQVTKKLNNEQIGGRRRNPWYYELWNIKYLKGFRWTHLNEKIAYQQEMRKQRLRQEVALAKKETQFYIQNVEKNEKMKRLKKKLEKNVNEQDSKINDEKETDKCTKKEYVVENADEKNEMKKRPIFERKIKVAGNETFLKQIFS